jgi:DNA polymerase-4
MTRALLLIDMDAFYASVEQARHPEFVGLPVIVGGKAESRGVVSTCSYKACTPPCPLRRPSASARRPPSFLST